MECTCFVYITETFTIFEDARCKRNVDFFLTIIRHVAERATKVARDKQVQSTLMKEIYEA
jgi:hypothetical protein